MSSLNILSISRCALQPARSIWRPANTLRTTFRSFSNTSRSRSYHINPIPVIQNTHRTGEDAAATWGANSKNSVNQILTQPLLNPYSGRTVAVSRSLGDSLKALDGILARNKVKFELRASERHEKKGVKRRRLASERWRNQFANEVRKNVQLVMKMRDRGA